MRCRAEATVAPPQPAARHEVEGVRGAHSSVRVAASASPGDGPGEPNVSHAGFEFGRIPAETRGHNATQSDGGWSRASSTEMNSALFPNRIPLVASIRIASSREELRPVGPLRLAFLYDKMQSGDAAEEIDPESLVPATGSGEESAAIAEPAEGQTIQLPDVRFPALEPMRDSIAGALAYNGSITQAGSPPEPFGETWGKRFSLSGISVTRSAGNFAVQATVDNPITFQVNGGSHTDIESENDPHITHCNYSKVASDLTPDMSDLDGKPPRKEFWAQDLTIRHERFHAQERLKFGGQGVQEAQGWLSGSIAANIAAVRALVNRVPARVLKTVSRSMTYPAKEQRAYRDGAPLYLARATAVKKKGDAKGYDPPPDPSGKTKSQSCVSRGAKVALGILGGAALGAGIGAAGGWKGALIGGGAGIVAGLITGLLV